MQMRSSVLLGALTGQDHRSGAVGEMTWELRRGGRLPISGTKTRIRWNIAAESDNQWMIIDGLIAVAVVIVVMVVLVMMVVITGVVV